jgi:hypothetical protein
MSRIELALTPADGSWRSLFTAMPAMEAEIDVAVDYYFQKGHELGEVFIERFAKDDYTGSYVKLNGKIVLTVDYHREKADMRVFWSPGEGPLAGPKGPANAAAK